MITEGLADHFALEVINPDTLAWKTTLRKSEYLKNHPGETAATLYAKPAELFL